MSIKEILKSKWVKVLSNKYLLITVIFLVWMIFFDENSFINHQELDSEIDKLEKSNQYYKEQIDEDKKVIKNLNDPDSLEKYAREQYKMKRDNEDIYIVEYDTVKEE